jgi:hypothetical protein
MAVVDRRIHQQRHRQIERVEHLEQTPSAHAIAVFAPRPVQHIGLASAWHNILAQTFAKRVALQIERHVNG